MKQLFAILIVAMTIASCGDGATDTTGPGTSSVGTPGAFDACSCTQYKDGNSPEYAKCKELRQADAKFEADFQQCALASKSGLDTNQVKLVKKDASNSKPITNSGTFKMDAAKSTVIWRGEKATGKSHKGTIAISEGIFTIENGNITSGSVAIDMTSIKVTDEEASSASKLETHLKSADFFDSAKFPKAKFEITRTTLESNQSVLATGNLTIKGITHEAKANLVLAPSGENVVVGGSLMFDRAVYDVRYGSDNFFQNLGNDLIKDEIILTFDLKAIKN